MRAAVFWTGLTLLAALGTAATVGTYASCWSEPDDLPLTLAGVLATHVLYCGLFMLLGESMIEDAVKSGMFVVGGGAGIANSLIRESNWLALLGLSAVSTGVCAFVAAQSFKWAYRR